MMSERLLQCLATAAGAPKKFNLTVTLKESSA